MADALTGAPTKHWTGREQRLTGLVRVDGKAMRFLGDEPQALPALPQTGSEVRATSSVCTFAGAGIALTVTFTTPALPDDLDLLARPVTYVDWSVRATDGASHAVALYLDANAEIAAEDLDHDTMACRRERIAGLDALRVGTTAQRELVRWGDGVRIDWGYLYLASAKDQAGQSAIAAAAAARDAFAAGARLPADDLGAPRTPRGGAPVLAFAFDAGQVAAAPVARWMALAYDQVHAASYFFTHLAPYWRRGGKEAADLLTASASEHAALTARCAAFDRALAADLAKVGGVKYAQLCALAYRQCWAGNVLCADANGQPLLFAKENSSNGCMATVDVFYPMAPQTLLFGATLTKAMLIPALDYGSSRFWTAPFAPHDMGCYPRAYVPNYGDMPVEETGNMLILTAALAKLEGNADFAGKYWPTLTKWAHYLRDKGYDPDHQLCTDDFTGPLAHQTNLSIKAITALGAWGYLCARHGDAAEGAEYTALAKELAQRWVKEAADGDHYRLAFDQPGTWGQKYNLIWDQVLGLELFPPAVRRTELAFYKGKLRPHGLPLDHRKDFTKVDWTVWCACFADTQADFAPFIDGVWAYVDETKAHQPFTDFHETVAIDRNPGFIARPVVGAVFMRALQDPAVWKAWAGKDAGKPRTWAPLPDLEPIPLAPAGDSAAPVWRVSTAKPADGWDQPGFDDAAWATGAAGFGAQDTLRGALRSKVWTGEDIWLRRTVDLARVPADLRVWCRHEGLVEVSVNGVPAMVDYAGMAGYYPLPLAPAALAALKPGSNLIAVHGHRRADEQRFVDVGLVELVDRARITWRPVVPSAADQPGTVWRTTTSKPADGWEKPGFAGASAWSEGKAPFGTILGAPTRWDAKDIWLRREVTLPADLAGDLVVTLLHDDDAEVYLDGHLAASATGFTDTYKRFDVPPEVRRALKPGPVTIAVHCYQNFGGQIIDAGVLERRIGK